MQKNAYKIIALTLLLMLLCGCKQSRSLGAVSYTHLYLDGRHDDLLSHR